MSESIEMNKMKPANDGKKKSHHHHHKKDKQNISELTELISPSNCEEFMKHLHDEEHHEHDHGHGHGHDHHDHDHSHVPKASWRLITMICLNLVFLLAELITGFVSNSLALQSDAFHMISDEASLIIGFVSHRLSKKPPDSKMTFGWQRMEVLGALTNSVFLLAICFMLFLEAIERFVEPSEITNGLLFLIVGCLGLFVNIIGMFIFHDHSHSDNIKGVFLHIVGDFFGSIGVVISACVVYFTDWEYAVYIDPIISLLIVCLLVHSCWPLFMRTAKIVIERVPESIDCDKITEQLMIIPHIKAIHELHVWELSRDNFIALIHIVVDSKEQNQVVIEMVHNLMLTFKIYSTTVQIEFTSDFPPQFNDPTNACFYASSLGKDKRVFSSHPVYLHTIGCPHYANPDGDGHEEHSHHHSHDLEEDYNVNQNDSSESDNQVDHQGKDSIII